MTISKDTFTSIRIHFTNHSWVSFATLCSFCKVYKSQQYTYHSSKPRATWTNLRPEINVTENEMQKHCPKSRWNFAKSIIFSVVCSIDWPLNNFALWQIHYGDVIMGEIASQITSFTIVYSAVYSDADVSIWWRHHVSFWILGTMDIVWVSCVFGTLDGFAVQNRELPCYYQWWKSWHNVDSRSSETASKPWMFYGSYFGPGVLGHWTELWREIILSSFAFTLSLKAAIWWFWWRCSDSIWSTDSSMVCRRLCMWRCLSSAFLMANVWKKIMRLGR